MQLIKALPIVPFVRIQVTNRFVAQTRRLARVIKPDISTRDAPQRRRAVEDQRAVLVDGHAVQGPLVHCHHLADEVAVLAAGAHILLGITELTCRRVDRPQSTAYCVRDRTIQPLEVLRLFS